MTSISTIALMRQTNQSRQRPAVREKPLETLRNENLCVSRGATRDLSLSARDDRVVETYRACLHGLLRRGFM